MGIERPVEFQWLGGFCCYKIKYSNYRACKVKAKSKVIREYKKRGMQRRASRCRGVKGARSPIVGVQRAKPFGKRRGRNKNPANPNNPPKQSNPQNAGLPKNKRTLKPFPLIKCADPISPAFPRACPPDVGKPRKERSDFAANKH